MSDPNTLNLLRLSLPINFAVFRGAEYEFGILGRPVYDYSWIFYMACVMAFITAAGSGSNDVANAFATSVGARSLKMWQAVIAASICEFSGAMLLGARTVDTVRSNIVTASLYTNHEDLLMFGMLCTLTWVGFWLFLASYFEINVSTTHSIIGSIVGFALCSPAGTSGINWDEIGRIVGSWFASPILAAIIAAFIYLTCRTVILRAPNSQERALLFFPVIGFLTMFLNAFFVMYNGGITTGKGLSRVNISVNETVGWAFLVAFVFGLMIQFCINPILKKRVNMYTDDQLEELMGYSSNYGQRLHNADGKLTEEQAVAAAADASNKKVEDAADLADSSVSSASSRKSMTPWWERKLDMLARQDSIHASMEGNAKIAAIHNKAEKFSIRTEFTFGYLQVMTACFASFAHGAGDVANYIGPLAAIDAVYKRGAGSLARRSPVDDWLLVLGGCGLIFGLATYGQKVIAAFGVKTVRITPTRGFAVELSAAVVIITAAFLAIPISTSHSFVGAIVGVGLCEGRTEAVNWHIILKNAAWWLSTLIVCAGIVAALFSWGTFAPSQIYPLSKDNCMAFYGVLYNTSNGDPSTFLVEARNGTIIGLYGYPSTGRVFSL